MIRGLLPVTLVNPGVSVSDIFVSFLAFTKLFSSNVEGNIALFVPCYLGKIPLLINNKIILSVDSMDKNGRIMYVCGIVAAGLLTKDSSVVDSQPRFLKNAIPYIKENITITYVLNRKI